MNERWLDGELDRGDVADVGRDGLLEADAAGREHAQRPVARRGEEAEAPVVAEVPLGEDGGFRFFAAPGNWTLRVLAPGGIRAERGVNAAIGEIRTLEVAV